MIHNVAPPRSDESALEPAVDPPARMSQVAGLDAPPGPISWDLETGPPGVPVEIALDPSASDSPGGRLVRPSWDSVPHPVGQPAEPPPVAATPAAGGREPVRPAPSPAPLDGAGPSAAPGPAFTASQPLVATAVHSLGPVGRRRSPALVFLAGVLTLGLHPVVWARRVNLEMSQFDPRMVVRPGRSATALAVVAVAPLLAAAAEVARIVADHLGFAAGLPISASASRWLLAAPALTPVLAILVPFSLVALTMTLERARVVEDRAGVDPEHQLSPAGTVWWGAVPLVGLAMVAARAQHRLNRVWDACAGPAGR